MKSAAYEVSVAASPDPDKRFYTAGGARRFVDSLANEDDPDDLGPEVVIFGKRNGRRHALKLWELAEEPDKEG